MGSYRFFDLAKWKLTLPVDKEGGITGVAVDIMDVSSFNDDRFFKKQVDGSITFTAAVDGATTKGSTNARSEFREMNGEKLAAWTLAQGGTMTATLRIDQLPDSTAKGGGKMVIGQIHGKSEELCRLYYENGTVYFKNDHATTDNKQATFLLRNAAGETPSITLGEKFSYKIDAYGEKLTVSVFADGQTYTSATTVNQIWRSDSFYFKAGVYLGNNESNGSGFGRATFDAIDFSHTPGKGLGGLVGGVLPTIEVPACVMVGSTTSGNDVITDTTAGETRSGGMGNDTLVGQGGNDSLWGNEGNDRINGGAGNDYIRGGSGTDTFVFEAGHGNDTVFQFRKGETLEFAKELFVSADAVRKAFVQTADGILLKTGVGSGILFTDTKMPDLLTANFRTITPTTSPLQTPTAHGKSYELKKAGVVDGGAGNDKILGSAFADTLRGGRGNDTIGGASGDDVISGDDGDDLLTGFNGADHIEGGTGMDVVGGGAGNDWLNGGAGNDRLLGDRGDDHLTGGWGADKLIGGGGKDVFYLATAAEGGDLISDFESGTDRLVLQLAGFGAELHITDEPFMSLPETHAGPSLLLDRQAGKLYFDADGDGLGDMNLLVTAANLHLTDIFFA